MEHTDDPTPEARTESYPALRKILGEDGFAELARLIRTTYEANEQRLSRQIEKAELEVESQVG